MFHHWVKVLRAQVSEKATLFNGQGGEYEVELVEVSKNRLLYRSIAITLLIAHQNLKPCLAKS